MGKILRLRNMKLKKVFMVTFSLIIVLSLIATLITSAVAYEFMYERRSTANNMKNLEDYIVSQGTEILNKNKQKDLERALSWGDTKYQILDEKLSRIYGNVELLDVNDYYKQDIEEDSMRIALIPILDNAHEIKGIALFKYQKTLPGYEIIFNSISILSPFIFLILFTIFFSFLLSNRIARPIQRLVEASRKVQQHDLDFTLNYEYDDEIGILYKSFEEMRNELKKSLFQMWQLERDRRDMVSAITHDLNTPLSIIQSSAENLTDGLMENREKLLKYFNIIQSNASRASSMLKDIKRVSYIESGEFKIYPREIDVTKFFNEKTDAYRILTEKKCIRIIICIEDKRSAISDYCFDPERVEEVLDNIVANSLRYTPLNGVLKIKVLVESDFLTVWVSDNGKGFRDKDIPNLFKKFFKGDNSRSLEKGHSGLGLFIAKTIVEKHGGAITAQNCPDGGAEIKFTIKRMDPFGFEITDNNKHIS